MFKLRTSYINDPFDIFRKLDVITISTLSTMCLFSTYADYTVCPFQVLYNVHYSRD